MNPAIFLKMAPCLKHKTRTVTVLNCFSFFKPNNFSSQRTVTALNDVELPLPLINSLFKRAQDASGSSEVNSCMH